MTVQVEEEAQKRNNVQSDLAHNLSEMSMLKAKEKQLIEEASHLRKSKKFLEEELCKLRT